MDGERQLQTEERIGIREDELDVHGGGRIRVPEGVRKAFGIGKPDLLSVTIHFEDGDGETVVEHFSNPMISGGRITIPARIRNNHGIGDGDNVDLTIKKVVKRA